MTTTTTGSAAGGEEPRTTRARRGTTSRSTPSATPPIRPDALPSTGPPRRDRPLLIASHVRAWSGEHLALDNVELTVDAGECVALLGRPGAGKSVLARCIGGLHTGEVEGYLEFDGVSLEWPLPRRDAGARRDIQFVPQEPQAFSNPRQKVGRIIGQPLATYRINLARQDRRRRVRELLEAVGLPADFEERYPDQAQPDERLRIALARALAARPRLLICDDLRLVLGGVEVEPIAHLLRLLRQRDDLTLLILTCEPAIAEAVADTVVVLDAGKVRDRYPTKHHNSDDTPVRRER